MKTVKLGQNFLINKNVAETIVKHFLPTDGNILEVGPGKGILTDLLVKHRKNNKIIAVELDTGLSHNLKDKYIENVQVISKNILKVNLPHLFQDEKKINLISNAPYYISSGFIDWIISQAKYIKKGILMMQKEFVDKLTARSPSKEYNAQSIVFNFLFHLEKVFDVNPGSFSPRPKVKSTVFIFKNLSEKIEPEKRVDIKSFYLFLKSCFKNRRKTMFNNLEKQHHKEELRKVFEVHEINHKIRAEQMDLEDFLNIYHFLFK